MIVNQESPLEIKLIDLTPAHTSEFLDLLNDDDVRKYFQDFDRAPAEIAERIQDGNNENDTRQQWLIEADGRIVGYITLKKSAQVFDVLNPVPELDVDDPNYFDELELRPEEQRSLNQKKGAEKLSLAPFSIDVIIHRDYRQLRIASRAFRIIADRLHAKEIDSIFLEVHQENGSSMNWVTGLGARWVTSVDDPFYPRHIFRYHLKRSPQVRDAVRELISFSEQLKTERLILNGLFDEFFHHWLMVEYWKDKETCKFKGSIGQTNREFRLGIGVKPRPNPMTMIWSLAHELGHSRQPEQTEAEGINGSTAQYAREKQAWDFATEWLQPYPYYQENIALFIAYRDELLSSYLPKE